MATSKTKRDFDKIDYPLFIGGLMAIFVAIAAGLTAGGIDIVKWAFAVPGMILIAMGASGITRGKYVEGVLELAAGVTMVVCALINPQLFWVVTGVVVLLFCIVLLFFTISAKQNNTKSVMKYMAVIFGTAAGIMLVLTYVHVRGKISIPNAMIWFIFVGIITGIFGIFLTAASLLIHEK